MDYRSLQYFWWVRTWSRPIRHLPMVLYANNLVLNFNCILPLALVSLPALGALIFLTAKDWE